MSNYFTKSNVLLLLRQFQIATLKYCYRLKHAPLPAKYDGVLSSGTLEGVSIWIW